MDSHSCLYVEYLKKQQNEKKQKHFQNEARKLKNCYFNFDSNVNTNPATKYTSEDRNNGSIVDTIGFAIVETEPKNAAEGIAAT